MYENLSEPIPLKKEIKLYTGTGNPALAEKISDILHLELQGLKIEKFANGEIYARFDESIRGDDVFFIQSLSGVNVNDLLMETLVVADAAKRASASKFTAVLPHYCYARQDRKAAAREPITARLVANLLEAAGVDQVITIDLHQGQIQGFFDIPVTHLTALYLIGDYFKQKDFDWENTVVVSPDMGRAKVAKRLSDYGHHRQHRGQDLHRQRRHDRHRRHPLQLRPQAQGDGRRRHLRLRHARHLLRRGHPAPRGRAARGVRGHRHHPL